jgi:cytochrome c oxidase cbb3-type subunit 4
MSYQDVAGFAQTGGLIYALLIFAAAVAYALWPNNQATFDEAARRPLEKEDL